MNKNILTYKKSGVDINAADKFVKFISNISTRKKGKKKLNSIGGFGSITNIPKNLKNPNAMANIRKFDAAPKMIHPIPRSKTVYIKIFLGPYLSTNFPIFGNRKAANKVAII